MKILTLVEYIFILTKMMILISKFIKIEQFWVLYGSHFSNQKKMNKLIASQFSRFFHIFFICHYFSTSADFVPLLSSARSAGEPVQLLPQVHLELQSSVVQCSWLGLCCITYFFRLTLGCSLFFWAVTCYRYDYRIV